MALLTSEETQTLIFQRIKKRALSKDNARFLCNIVLRTILLLNTEDPVSKRSTFLNSLERTFDFFDSVGLDNVTDFDIIVALDVKTTILTHRNFLDIVLESLE